MEFLSELFQTFVQFPSDYWGMSTVEHIQMDDFPSNLAGWCQSCLVIENGIADVPSVRSLVSKQIENYIVWLHPWQICWCDGVWRMDDELYWKHTLM